jgi:putative ABC transport system substrate-binding protein
VVLKTPNDFLAASDAIVRGRSQALVVDNSAPTYVQGPAILDFATKHRLPVVGAHREIAEVGGLLSYGASLGDLFRRTGLFVDRILRGAKPADLPVEQPTKFELVINLKTAKALGLTIPQSVLARADEIIQ